ncbi:MAG: transposase [Polyangiaceae bacterium]
MEIEIVPDEVKRIGLDAFERIGEEVTEVLERRPASLVVARIIKAKFKRKDAEPDAPVEVLVGSTPELPIERGLAGPGMLADTLVRRWQDHLPLNRLEGIYAREGVQLARSTVCGWHAQLAPLAEPLIAAMRDDSRARTRRGKTNRVRASPASVGVGARRAFAIGSRRRPTKSARVPTPHRGPSSSATVAAVALGAPTRLPEHRR